MTSHPNHPRNQHYVPQFLLRNFTAGKRKQLHVFDKLRESRFTTSPRNVAAEAGFYDFEYDGRQHSLEPFMARMEAGVSRIVEGILHKESLSHLTKEDRIAVSLFAAVQQLRVRGARHRIKSMISGLRNCLADRGIDPGDAVPEMNDDDVKHYSLSSISMAKEFAKHFYNKAWVLQRAPRGNPFCTSDNPITLYNLVKRPGRGNFGLESPGVEIYLPISKQFSICFLCRSIQRAIQKYLQDAAEVERSSGFCPHDISSTKRIAQAVASGDPDPLLPENVTHQNSLQVLYSSRFVFSSNGDFELVKSMITANPQLKCPPKMVFE